MLGVYTDSQLPGNSTGFSTSPIDLSNLPFEQLAVNNSGKIGRLILKVTMTTSNTNVTPSLDFWSIAWTRTQGDLSASPLASTAWPSTGEAIFENVEKGEHKIVIAYKDQVGEQKVNLEGEVKGFDFAIQIKQTSSFSSPTVILATSISVLIITGLLVWVFRLKRKAP